MHEYLIFQQVLIISILLETFILFVSSKPGWFMRITLKICCPFEY